jgi:hypothetical protein
MIEKLEKKSSHHDRREFLKLTSVGIAGIATSAAGSDAMRDVAASFLAQPLPLLGVGYCNPQSAHPDRVISADRLSSGDSRFGDVPVRLRIVGFRRAGEHAGKSLSIGLNVHYPEAQFIAWRSSSRGRTLLNSSPVAASVPVADTRALTLSIDALSERPAALRALASRIAPAGSRPRFEESIINLGFGTSDATTKLRRGVYILAFRESAGEGTPAWSSLRYRADDSTLSVAGLEGERPASFSHIVLTTDYATT